MARLFTTGYFTYNAPLTGVPLTLACWVKPADVTNSYNVMSVNVAGASDQGRFHITLNGALAGDPFRCSSVNSAGTSGFASISSSATAGNWQHACAVFAAANSRAIFRNGTGKGTNTTSITVNTLTTGIIGGSITTAGTAAANWAGDMAEIGIWNVALTDAQVAELASGVACTAIRPDALVGYWPLFPGDTQQDKMSALTMTAGGTTPTASDGPPIIYPGVPQMILPARVPPAFFRRSPGMRSGMTMLQGGLS